MLTPVEIGRGGAEEKLSAAWEVASVDLRSRLFAAAGVHADWLDRVRAVVGEMLEYPDAQPAHAKVIYVEGAKARAQIRGLIDRDIDLLVEFIDCGRRELRRPSSLTRATAEGLAGAIYELISMRLIRGSETGDLTGLLPQLMFMIARPYLGLETALAEFHRAG